MTLLRSSSILNLQDCLLIWKEAVQESQVQKSIEAEHERTARMMNISMQSQNERHQRLCSDRAIDAFLAALTLAQNRRMGDMQYCFAAWTLSPQSAEGSSCLEFSISSGDSVANEAEALELEDEDP